MRIKVIKLLNTRIGGPHRTFKKGTERLPGEEIEVMKVVKGEGIYQNDDWYFDGVDKYYWSGGATLQGKDEIARAGVMLASKVLAANKDTQKWFAEEMKIPAIWSQYGVMGEGVTIAILDSGFDTNNADVAEGVVEQIVFIDHADSIQDIFGHGTRCASLAGCRNSLSFNIGAAPKSRLLAAKISNVGELNDFEGMKKAVTWAVNKGADIISISYAKFSEDPAAVTGLYDHLKEATVKRQVLVFAGAGNNYDATPAEGILYPSALAGTVSLINRPALPNLISVGSTDEEGKLALITLRNTYTFLHTPGINIRSYGLGTTPDFDSGTSMSTAIAAGMAALAVSYKKKKTGSWNAAALKQLLLQSATQIPGAPAGKKKINLPELFKKL